MNSIPLTTVTFAALCAFGSACADAGSPRTRADVVAEVHAARTAGTLGVLHGEDSGSFHLSRQLAPSGLTRDEVRAQVAAARAAGELGAMNAEDGGSHFLALHAAPGTRSRDEVRAEMLAARASGELQAMTGEDSGSFYLARAHAADRPAWIAAR
jgi:hypothetical protein